MREISKGVDSEAMTGGFSNPVFDAQSVFRQVMDGMARPGSIQTLDVSLRPPGSIGLATAAIALTLCDPDTPVWLSSGYAATNFASWLSFQTGAVSTAERSDARFAFLDYAALPPSFGLFALGSLDYPDRSTTLVVEIPGFDGGMLLELKGPGIRDRESLAPQGVDTPFLSRWQENRLLYPRGIDLIFTAGAQFTCLPRSVNLTRAEA